MAAPPPALPPIPPNIAQLTAPLLIGDLLGTYLFGILTVQLYIYHLNFPQDAKHIKALVYTVFFLDLASSVMCVADAYHWFASGYGNLLALNDIYLSVFDTPMIGAFLSAIVQCFYCYRLWTLNKRTLPVCILIVLIALTTVVSGVYGAILAHRVKNFSAVTQNIFRAADILNISAAAADVLIAVTMAILLTRQRSNGHRQTDFIARKIINLTVETNLLSSIFAVLTVILIIGLPGTNYYTAPSIMLGKIYSNSFLLMLNNRKYISDSLANGAGSQPSNRSIPFRGGAIRNVTVDSRNQDISLDMSSSIARKQHDDFF